MEENCPQIRHIPPTFSQLSPNYNPIYYTIHLEKSKAANGARRLYRRQIQIAITYTKISYQEFEEKSKDRTRETEEAIAQGLMGIFAEMGQMYATGGEFTENIDAAGGVDTAEFANQAIQIYCRK